MGGLQAAARRRLSRARSSGARPDRSAAAASSLQAPAAATCALHERGSASSRPAQLAGMRALVLLATIGAACAGGPWCKPPRRRPGSCRRPQKPWCCCTPPCPGRPCPSAPLFPPPRSPGCVQFHAGRHLASQHTPVCSLHGADLQTNAATPLYCMRALHGHASHAQAQPASPRRCHKFQHCSSTRLVLVTAGAERAAAVARPCHARVGSHPAALPLPALSNSALQHDDAITAKTYDSMRSVTDGVDANGCPAVATMFVTSTGTGAGHGGWAVVGRGGRALRSGGGARPGRAARQPASAAADSRNWLAALHGCVADCELLVDLYQAGYEVRP